MSDGARVPTWAAAIVLGASAFLVPWILILYRTQPPRGVEHHLRLLWTGLDTLELLGLLSTGVGLLRRSRNTVIAAVFSATLLVADAWFNVIATKGHARAAAVGMAFLAELPLAALCFMVAHKMLRVSTSRYR